MIIDNNVVDNITPQIVMKEGLNRKSSTKGYSNNGNFFPKLTARFRPANLPKWIDLNVAFGVDLEIFGKPYYQFPMFNEQVLVFNRDIASYLFAYIEDIYDGGTGRIVEGLPSKEELMKSYWASMSTLDNF